MVEGDPIIFLDHGGPHVNGPGAGRGAPWHPHRRIETVSCVMDDEVSHHDTNDGGGSSARATPNG
jgi:redox-sensitive bicupin YhaK (pirin superfamily)